MEKLILSFDGRAEILRFIAKELLRQHDASWKLNHQERYATAKAELNLTIPGLTVEVIKEDI